MLIDIKETHPPDSPRRSGTVVTSDGTRLDCWPNLMRTIQVGRRYEVETSTNDRGYTSITKATPINGAAQPAANGATKANGHASAPAASPPSDGEAEYVGRALHALILKGEVGYNEQHLQGATAMLRQIWRTTSEGRR
jgi:hypothetical protein